MKSLLLSLSLLISATSLAANSPIIYDSSCASGAFNLADNACLGAGGGGVTSVSGSSPILSSGGATPIISCQVATGGQAGCLASADFTTFNAKQSALTFGAISTSTTGVTVGSGANSTVGPNVTVDIQTATTAQPGLLSAADWNTFNGKQAALTLGNLSDAGTDGLTVTGGAGAVVGAGTSLSQHVSDTTHNGYLNSADWNTFNGKQAALTFGSVTTSTTGVTVGNGANSTVGPNVTVDIQTATGSQPGLLSAADWTNFNSKLANTDGAYSLLNTADNTKIQKWDLSGLTTGTTTTFAPLSSQNQTYNIQPNVDATANILTQNATSGQVFIGANASIGGSNSGIQYSNATTANRGQIRLGSYVNAASVAGVTTATSKSGVVGTNSVIGTSQDYSKWTAQAAANTAGSLPISGSWAFKSAASINALTVPTDFHISLENLAGAGVFDRLYLTSEGILTLSGYGSGLAHFNGSGLVSSSAVDLTADVTGILPVPNGGTGLASLTAHNVLLGAGASPVSFAAPSTAGFILTDNGAGADPTFQAPAAVAPGSITLTQNHILVGNASNVAADVGMSGDASIVSSGALTLATVNASVGSFGSSTSIPSFTVNGKGLITAASGNAVIAPAGTLTGATLNATVTASSLTSVGTITSGTWNGTTVDVPHGGTGDTTFTSNLPLIGNGAGALAQGTVSGSTTEFGTVTGALTTNHCLKADASGNIVDSGAACSAATVTSVALADGSTSPIFTISGSPVTGAGTLTETLSNQNANLVFAGPTSGGAAQPTFRSLVAADLPAWSVVNGGDAAYSILTGDQHVRSGTALTAQRTYTLPVCAANIGERHEVKNLPSQGFNILVAGNGADTVDLAANYVLVPGDSVQVICAVSGNWDVE